MTGAGSGMRIALAVPVGFAVYAAASFGLLRIGWPLPDALFPLAMLAGVVLGWILAGDTPWSEPAPDSSRALLRTVSWVGIAAVGVVVVAVAYGAVATPDREWDGLVSWSLRAEHLVPPADLSQPYFADPAVCAHSLPYPLLQPLALGACQGLVGTLPGRLFFPAVFLAFLGLIAAVARATGMPATHRRLLVASFGLTPMWFSTGSGAVDSGYAELLTGYFLAVGAAGLLLERRALLVAAAFCLPLVKPEGLPWSVLLCLAAGAGTGRRTHLLCVAGLVAALSLWLPLQARWVPRSTFACVFLPVALGLVLLALPALQRRFRWRARTWVLGGVAMATLVGSFLIFWVDLDDGAHPLLQEFGGNLVDLPRRLRDAPTLAAGYLEGFLFVRKFGLLFPMVLCTLVLRRTWTGSQAHRALAGFFVAGLAIACLAIALGDGTDWDHEFESRFDRLLLQWVGVGWLLLGPRVSEWVGRSLPAASIDGSDAGGSASCGTRVS